jgi:uncharacterized protein
MMKWKVLLLTLLLGTQTLAIAGLPEGITAYKAKDYATALKEFLPLANQGNAQAQLHLGNMYRNGTGVPKDEKQAVDWYRKAAEQGYAMAQNNLGMSYDNGTGVPKDEKQAVDWFRKAAEQGDTTAQNNLGVMYADGTGVPKDEKQAVDWYRKAAEQGLAMAQNNLGRMYADGTGVPEDEKQAVDWYRKAAEQGNVDAIRRLAVMYTFGRGVHMDLKQAASWNRKAAEQGDMWGQFNLGRDYEEGRGVPGDGALAYMLYNLAAAQGIQIAIDFRASLGQRLSRKQVAEGQALASAWQPGTPLPRMSRTGKIVAPAKKVTTAVPPPTASQVVKRTPVPSETMATGNCRPQTSHITCQSQCFNGDCVVTYANGCKMRVTVASKFNPFTSQWEYPSPSC